jgi:hypothetical protein
MRAIVGDVLGKFRLVDLWNDTTVFRGGGDTADSPDRGWACGAITPARDHSFCIIHQSGYASFIDVDRQTRTKIVPLTEPSPAHAVSFVNDVFVGCYSGSCIIFSESEKISGFPTVECSCAAANPAEVAYGRIADRTTVYDLASGEIKWTAAPPPYDELRLALPDDDRSIIFTEENVLIVGQNGGVALVYDERFGVEAVIRARPFPEFPLTALAQLSETLIAVGDTIGSLTIVDLRMADAQLKGYKGFQGAPAGTIQIVPHPSLPLFSVLSQDRVLRLYDHTKKLKVSVKSAFVRTMGTCLAMMDDAEPVAEDPSNEDWEALPENQDEIWEGFPVQVKSILPPPAEE